MMSSPRPLPNIGAPAARALEAVAIFTLDDLRDKDLDELAKLHGVGPAAIRRLREALGQTGVGD